MGVTPSKPQPAEVVETVGRVTILRAIDPDDGKVVAIYRYGGIDHEFSGLDLDRSEGARMVRESTARDIESEHHFYSGPDTGAKYAA